MLISVSKSSNPHPTNQLQSFQQVCAQFRDRHEEVRQICPLGLFRQFGRREVGLGKYCEVAVCVRQRWGWEGRETSGGGWMEEGRAIYLEPKKGAHSSGGCPGKGLGNPWMGSKTSGVYRLRTVNPRPITRLPGLFDPRRPWGRMRRASAHCPPPVPT